MSFACLDQIVSIFSPVAKKNWLAFTDISLSLFFDCFDRFSPGILARFFLPIFHFFFLIFQHFFARLK